MKLLPSIIVCGGKEVRMDNLSNEEMRVISEEMTARFYRSLGYEPEMSAKEKTA